MNRIAHMLRSGLCGAAGAAGVCLGLGVILAYLTIANTVAGYFFESLQFAFTFAPIVAVQAILGFLFGATRVVQAEARLYNVMISGMLHWAGLAAPFVLGIGVFVVIDLVDRPSQGGRSLWYELAKIFVALTGHLLCGAGAGLNVGLYLRRRRQSAGQ